MLEAGADENRTWAAAGPAPDPSGSSSLDLAEAQERRGRQIITALQERAREQRRGPPGESEQRTVLETITNLPTDVIDRVVRTSTPAGTARAGDAVRAANPATVGASTADASQAARPWEKDFPVPIRTVVATAAEPSTSCTTSSAT